MGLNTLEKPESITFEVASVDQRTIQSDPALYATVITLSQVEQTSLNNQDVTFVQTEDFTEAGVAVQPYGAFIINEMAPSANYDALIPAIRFADGTEYVTESVLSDLLTVGETVTFAASESDGDGGDEGGGGVG